MKTMAAKTYMFLTSSLVAVKEAIWNTAKFLGYTSLRAEQLEKFVQTATSSSPCLLGKKRVFAMLVYHFYMKNFGQRNSDG
jgi:hypothetical protein